jgi:hypothetical protein
VTPINGSPIARAVAELETERDHLTARLGKVNEAIATMRELFHLPQPRNGTAQPKAATRRAPALHNGNGHGDVTIDAIRAALAAGPMRPGDLAAQLNMDRAALRVIVRGLEADGVLVSSGTTMSRRIALRTTRADRPAKKAP